MKADTITPSRNRDRIIILLIFIVFAVMLPRMYYDWDNTCWRQWALEIFHSGLTNIYADNSVNYHPIFLYVLYCYDKIQGSEQKIIENINQLKYFTMCFDFLPLVVLCCFRQRFFKQEIPYTFLLFNVAYLFNSIYWGQVDSIPTNLAFLAIIIACYTPVAAAVLFMLALCTKLQAIIFTPILIILYLYRIKSIRQLLMVLLAMAVTLTIVVLPFAVKGKLPQLQHVLTSAVGFYPHLTQGAFNFWLLVTKDAPNIDDSLKVGGLSYKHWGLILFSVTTGTMLLTFFFRMLRLRLEKLEMNDNTQNLMFLCGGAIALFFFYFTTEMHERYSHPMVIFFFFYSILSRNYLLYIVASLAYLINLNIAFPQYLPFSEYKDIFTPTFTAWVYTLAVVIALVSFFKNYNPAKEYLLFRSALRNPTPE
jgi:Gpi18-like mannosyltransferase